MKAVGRGLSLAADTIDLGLDTIDVRSWQDIEICVDGSSKNLAMLDLCDQAIPEIARIGERPAGIVRETFVS